MDFFNKNGASAIHIEPWSRHQAAAPPVRSIGHIPHKREPIDRPFDTCNYSIILNGTGTYRHRGTDLRVSAPCAFIQWPGTRMTYGPNAEWQELFFIYDAGMRTALDRTGMFRPDDPLWYFAHTDILRALLEQLGRALPRVDAPGMADRIDHLCEAVVLETRLARTPAPMAADELLVRTMETELRERCTEPDAVARIAKRHGLHPAAFRRLWNKYNSITPGAYAAARRMAEACRLLVETRLSAGEIAHRVGYEDELYFYRKFRKTFGVTAGEYRKQRLADASFPL